MACCADKKRFLFPYLSPGVHSLNQVYNKPVPHVIVILSIACALDCCTFVEPLSCSPGILGRYSNVGEFFVLVPSLFKLETREIKLRQVEASVGTDNLG